MKGFRGTQLHQIRTKGGNAQQHQPDAKHERYAQERQLVTRHQGGEPNGKEQGKNGSNDQQQQKQAIECIAFAKGKSQQQYIKSIIPAFDQKRRQSRHMRHRNRRKHCDQPAQTRYRIREGSQHKESREQQVVGKEHLAVAGGESRTE